MCPIWCAPFQRFHDGVNVFEDTAGSRTVLMSSTAAIGLKMWQVVQGQPC